MQNNVHNLLNILGHHAGESVIIDLLNKIGEAPPKKIKRGDDTTHVCSKKSGLELTFKGEKFITESGNKYPEGALVAFNVRCYLNATEDFDQYEGELPFGIDVACTKSNLLTKLGQPEWVGMEGTRLRWRTDNCLVFATSDSSDAIKIIAFQML